MKPSLLYLSASTACAFAVAACGGGHTASSPTPSHTGGPVAAAAPSHGVSASVTISVASTRLGEVLVDGSGRTVYIFEADKDSVSTCYDVCAQAWPPVTTTGFPRAGTGASGALLGTTSRKDGKTQVTYAGHPLYYYIADKRPGDLNGQGLSQFGAKWYVLAPSGKKIDRA